MRYTWTVSVVINERHHSVWTVNAAAVWTALVHVLKYGGLAFTKDDEIQLTVRRKP